MKATTRSARSERRDRRKQRRKLERDIEAARRSRRVIGALAFVPLLASLSCSSLDALWCVIPPFFYMLAFSSLAGLFIGATIRLIRERRKLEHYDGR